MVALFCFLLALFASPFKSKSGGKCRTPTSIDRAAAVRHQLTVLRRKVRRRVQFTSGDRLFLIQLHRWFPSIFKVVTIVRPETSCVGIVPAFAGTGVGNPGAWEVGRKSMPICGL
jgi:hypothetical protein